MNAPSKSGFTPLTQAVHDNQFEIVKYLVEKCGADINECCCYGWAPIHLALSRTDGKIGAYIMQHPLFNANVQRIGGKETPLMYAILYDHLELANKLFDRKDVDLTLKDSDGKTYVDYLKHAFLKNHSKL